MGKIRKGKRVWPSGDLGLAVLWIIGAAIASALMLAILNQLLVGGSVPHDGIETVKMHAAAEQNPVEAAADGSDTAAPTPVSARAAVVMDQTSGRILYEKNGEERVYPASTTKIMTALLGIEYGQLDREVTVGGRAIGVEGSSIYLVEGETLTMEDLLYGAMLRSGNDAATAIAMEIGGWTKDDGTVALERFVELMNRRAKELGAVNTQFTNPTGLHDENHYTTACDMALMARAAMEHPAFAKIAAAQSWTAKRQEDRDPYFYNKNKVVHQYQGGTGVKIGYTTATGRTLVASSERDGRKILCVVMNAPDWFNDSYRLMDWAHENYETVTAARGGLRLERVAVEDGVRTSVWVGVREDVTCLVQSSERDRVGIALAVRKPVKAPIRRGDEAGQLHVYVSGEYVYSVPLYFLEDVDEVRK